MLELKNSCALELNYSCNNKASSHKPYENLTTPIIRPRQITYDELTKRLRISRWTNLRHSLQRAYEPFQRVEFLKNIYAAGPTTQSAITSTTTPSAAGNPLAQAAGAGLGAYATYSMFAAQFAK